MNKSMLAIGLALGGVGAAQAQSSVTLYGIADAGVSYTHGQEGGSTKLVSGIMEGSRFGFRGNEDIGGGFTAIFTLENRLELDTGALSNRPASGNRLPARFNTTTALGLPAALQPVVNNVSAGLGARVGVNHIENNFFDRQAFLGLITPVGAVLMGRQYTPAYEMNATFDTMQTSSSLAFGQIASFPQAIEIRSSNTVAYRIRTGPWNAALMVGAGEGSGTTGRLVGGNFMYKTPALSVGVGYQRRDNEFGEKALTSAVVGASAALGPGTLFVQYVNAKDDSPGGLSPVQAQLTPTIGAGLAATVIGAYRNALRQDTDAFHIGYRYNINDWNTLSVVYNRLEDGLRADADIQSYGFVYSYAFSKRTDLSLVVGRVDNGANVQVATGGQGYLGGFTTAPGRDFENVAVGLRHRF